MLWFLIIWPEEGKKGSRVTVQVELHLKMTAKYMESSSSSIFFCRTILSYNLVLVVKHFHEYQLDWGSTFWSFNKILLTEAHRETFIRLWNVSGAVRWWLTVKFGMSTVVEVCHKFGHGQFGYRYPWRWRDVGRGSGTRRSTTGLRSVRDRRSGHISEMQAPFIRSDKSAGSWTRTRAPCPWPDTCKGDRDVGNSCREKVQILIWPAAGGLRWIRAQRQRNKTLMSHCNCRALRNAGATNAGVTTSTTSDYHLSLCGRAADSEPRAPIGGTTNTIPSTTTTKNNTKLPGILLRNEIYSSHHFFPS